MRGQNLARYGEYIALGTHIAASMIVPVIIGIYVDRYWNISPWGVIIGALLGFGGLISIVIRLAAKTGETEYPRKDKNSGDG
jgi:F0F1-type ATP synthase assembly protein I